MGYVFQGLALNIGKYAGTLYIDDFEVYYTKSSNTIPLTDEEKKKALDCLMAQYHGTGRSFFYDDEVVARTKVFRLEVISMTGKRR